VTLCQADSRARPRRRRALMIACPARVDMRCLNPCLRARFLLFGWKVRFIGLSVIEKVWSRHHVAGPTCACWHVRPALLKKDAAGQASLRTRKEYLSILANFKRAPCTLPCSAAKFVTCSDVLRHPVRVFARACIRVP
jgi:hypothetical protein